MRRLTGLVGEDFPAVLGELIRVGAEGGLGGEGEAATVEVGDVRLGDADAQVIA